MTHVREAMVSNPGQLPADASAQTAAELLQRPEVRAVYVTEDDRLVGVVTRSTCRSAVQTTVVSSLAALTMRTGWNFASNV